MVWLEVIPQCPLLPLLGGSDTDSALRPGSVASTSTVAVNKGCVLYHRPDDLWGPQHPADSHLDREENDLMLKKFGS